MYCPSCLCMYPELLKECPPCSMTLVSGTPVRELCSDDAPKSRELFDVLEARGGSAETEVRVKVVGRMHHFTIPYFGFGFAWAHRMEGMLGELAVQLQASEVGMDRSWTFPNIGRGYAWIQTAVVSVGGCPILLTASEVKREKRWEFPYQGYGFAWTAKMDGRCGTRIVAELVTTGVSRKKEMFFLWRGHGYAWEETATLLLRAIS